MSHAVKSALMGRRDGNGEKRMSVCGERLVHACPPTNGQVTSPELYGKSLFRCVAILGSRSHCSPGMYWQVAKSPLAYGAFVGEINIVCGSACFAVSPSAAAMRRQHHLFISGLKRYTDPGGNG
jgi:hypothetical protein